MIKITLQQGSKLYYRTHPYGWIVLIGFIVYIQTLSFKFTYFDDNVLILDHYHFLKNAANIFKTFRMEVFHIRHAPTSYYRPLLTISLILDANLGETSPLIYHLTNLNLHLLASCLLFLFLTKLKYKPRLAGLFALIFTTHPVLTQAVAWIPGRNDSLVTVFILSSFIFLINFLETKKWEVFSWHLLFFALALFTKELSALLPLIFILYLWLIYKKRLTADEKKAFPIGWSLVLVFWFLLRQSAIENPIKYTLPHILKSLFLNSPAILLYLGKIIFPVNLSVLPIIQDSTLIYGGLVIILLIVSLLLSKNKRFNFLAFGLLWFLLFLLPSFIRPDPHIAADFIEHRVYLPLIGFILVLLEIEFIKNLAANKKRVFLLGAAVVLIFSAMTINHSRNFKNRLNFWQNAVKTSPHHPSAHCNLGATYYLDDRLDEAEIEYKKALEFNPRQQTAHNNLGLIYMDKGLFKEAEEEYKKEIEIDPYCDKVHFNLGLLYYQQKEMEKAVEWWQKTILINPEYFSAHINLAAYYYQQKEFNKAIYHCNEVLKRGGQVPPELLQTLKLRSLR